MESLQKNEKRMKMLRFEVASFKPAKSSVQVKTSFGQTTADFKELLLKFLKGPVESSNSVKKPAKIVTMERRTYDPVEVNFARRLKDKLKKSQIA